MLSEKVNKSEEYMKNLRKLVQCSFHRWVLYVNFSPKVSVKLRNATEYQLGVRMFQKLRQNMKITNNTLKNQSVYVMI